MDIVISRKGGSYKKFIFFIGAFVLVLSTFFYLSGERIDVSHIKEAVPYNTTVKFSVTATVQPFTSISKTSSVEGTVVSVLKKSGDLVQLGETVIEIQNAQLQADFETEKLNLMLVEADFFVETSRLDSELISIEERINTIQLELEEAETVLAAYSSLIKTGAYSKLNYLQVEYSVKKLRSQLDSLVRSKKIQIESNKSMKANLEKKISIQNSKVSLKEQQVQSLRVLATSSGILSSLEAKVGDSVKPDTVLFSINDVSEYIFSLSVPDFFHDQVKVGSHAVLWEPSSKDKFAGVVYQIDKQSENGHFTVYVRSDDLAGQKDLLLGNEWRAEIDSGNITQAFKIKRSGWMNMLGDIKLYVMDSPNSASLRSFEIISYDDEYVVIRNFGLANNGFSYLDSEPSLYKNSETINFH
jgi:HlyD family secretion protein